MSSSAVQYALGRFVSRGARASGAFSCLSHVSRSIGLERLGVSAFVRHWAAFPYPLVVFHLGSVHYRRRGPKGPYGGTPPRDTSRWSLVDSSSLCMTDRACAMMPPAASAAGLCSAPRCCLGPPPLRVCCFAGSFAAFWGLCCLGAAGLLVDTSGHCASASRTTTMASDLLLLCCCRNKVPLRVMGAGLKRGPVGLGASAWLLACFEFWFLECELSVWAVFVAALVRWD